MSRALPLGVVLLLQVVAALASHNITSFTPIQRETFDPLYDGRDMIGRSRTGTGKTLAFGLPICEVVAKAQAERGVLGKRGRKPVVIILAPTRELAKQCEDQLSRVGKPLGLWIRTIYGGVSYDRQMRDLETGFDILVGTPGQFFKSFWYYRLG
jgi:ATP-dependent RNA helicase DDX21